MPYAQWSYHPDLGRGGEEFGQRFPADFIAEGLDQTRGWFYTLMAEGVLLFDQTAYRTVICHGLVVDRDGRKMSKSVGNTVAPDKLIAQYGAEVLRLWVAAEDYTEDIRLSMEILDRLADAYRRIRNTFRFLLGNLGDFDPARDRQSYARLDEVDRWILDRLARLIGRVTRAYEEYQFHTVFHSAHNFCAVDLSAQYLDIIKDRLYTSAPDDPRRRAAQTTCYEVFRALTRLLAPILTFTTEEAWQQSPGTRSESVHLERFPEAQREWLDETLAQEWSRLLEVRREVAKALESARAGGVIGSGLEAAVRIAQAPEDLPALLRAKGDLLPTLFIVSQVAIGAGGGPAAVHYESQEIPGLVIDVERARGQKCARCWIWSERVGDNRDHPMLCERCVPVILAISAAR
jgi:isoleucyl-tRNA synthetase